MATFNKFHRFPEDLAEGTHTNLSSNTLELALAASANAPTSTMATALSNLAQISYTGLPARTLTVSESTYVAGTGYRLKINDITLTASLTVAGFRYVVLFNQSATSPTDAMIGWWDYGSEVILNPTETFTVDFDDTNGVLTIG